jgi:transcriptional regulator with XRE-family HTH domain
MNKLDYYAMTDAAIAEALGERLEQLRLEANIPQKKIAHELGISEGTYRSAVKGRAKFEVIIGILRVLGKLENLENFLPNEPFSPLELLKREGKKRQRAGTRRTGPEFKNRETDEAEALEW